MLCAVNGNRTDGLVIDGGRLLGGLSEGVWLVSWCLAHGAIRETTVRVVCRSLACDRRTAPSSVIFSILRPRKATLDCS